MRHAECPPGKDAPLSETIARGTRLLAEMNLDASPVSWLNPAPHCWSVHFQVEGCPPLASNGKGTSREACLAGALGSSLKGWQPISISPTTFSTTVTRPQLRRIFFSTPTNSGSPALRRSLRLPVTATG